MITQKKLFSLSLCITLLGSGCACNEVYSESHQQTQLVTQVLDAKTPLILQEFLDARNAGRTDSRLLDFSFAGYHHSEIGVPHANWKVFNVADYGAVANDNQSDRQAFIDAIAAAEANKSGIILFPAGRFILHSEGDPDASIVIKNKNIVLRGAGSGAGGTELFMETPIAPANPAQMWASPSMIIFDGGYTSSKVSDVVADAPKGSFSVKLASVGNLKVGQWVILSLTDNNPELVAKELHPYPVDPKLTEIINGVQVRDIHQIKAINGTEITFKEPIMHGVESKYKWNVTRLLYSEENGVEDIAFVGNFHETFVHHKNWLHDGGYKPINFKNTVNSWLRRCRFVDVSEAMSVINCANVSVYSCSIEGNRGHAAIRSQGSSRVFLGAINDRAGQWHSVGVSKPAMGTVIWRVSMAENTSFEMHASQPRATLFDACDGGPFNKGVGGDAANTPFHLADLVYWNYRQKQSSVAECDLWGTRYKGFVMPLFVGFHGADTRFRPEQVSVDESHGSAVTPESLFEEQLQLRLGVLPTWLVELKSEINR